MITYTHQKCEECGEGIGFAGQSPAYSNPDGGFDCEKHTDQKWKRKIDTAQAESEHDRARRRLPLPY